MKIPCLIIGFPIRLAWCILLLLLLLVVDLIHGTFAPQTHNFLEGYHMKDLWNYAWSGKPFLS